MIAPPVVPTLPCKAPEYRTVGRFPEASCESRVKNDSHLGLTSRYRGAARPKSGACHDGLSHCFACEPPPNRAATVTWTHPNQSHEQ